MGLKCILLIVRKKRFIALFFTNLLFLLSLCETKSALRYEPCHDNICLWGFRLGPTQSGQMARGLKFKKERDCTFY